MKKVFTTNLSFHDPPKKSTLKTETDIRGSRKQEREEDRSKEGWKFLRDTCSRENVVQTSITFISIARIFVYTWMGMSGADAWPKGVQEGESVILRYTEA